MADADVRAEIEARIQAEVVPLLDKTRQQGGYDCCGCSTYQAIVDDVLAIVRGES